MDNKAVVTSQKIKTAPVTLKCLIVEDNPADAELMVLNLTQEGYQVKWQRVDNETDYLAALENPFDLILSDWSMPQFSGLKALQWMQQRQLDIPFMIVSGGIGEETAIALMHQGAADYLWKDRMGRLGQAVKNALEKHRLKIANIQAAKALEASEAELRALFSAMQDVVLVFDRAGVYRKVAPTNPRLLLKPAQDLLGHRLEEFFPPAKADEFLRAIEQVLATQEMQWIEYHLSLNNQLVWFQASISPISADEVIAVAREITAGKMAEEALRESERRYQLISNAASDYMFSTRISANGKLELDWTGGAFEAITGYSMQEYTARGGWRAALHPDDIEKDDWDIAALRANQKVITEIRTIRKDGSIAWVKVYANPVLDAETQELIGIYGAVQDITARKQAEEETRRRLADLEAVNRISTILRGAQTLDELLPRLLDDVRWIFQTDTAAIWLFDPNLGQLLNTISSGWLASEKRAAQVDAIAQQVLHSGVSFISPKTTPDMLPGEAGDPVPSNLNAVCVPIHAEKETIGVCFTTVEQEDRLTDENVRLLTIVCEIAGNAIRRIQLFQQTQQQLKRLSALHNIDLAISATRELDQLLDQLLHHITWQLAVDAADILLLDSKNQTLAYKAGLGFRTDVARNAFISFEGKHVGRSLKERQVAGDSYHPLQPEVPCMRIQRIAEEEFVAHFAAPLIVKDEVKGVLEIFHRSSLTPDKEWLDYFETLAGQVAIAIENAALFESLQRSNAELRQAYDATIVGWSQAMDLRDKETEDHTRRVTEITLRLANRLGISEDQISHIWRGALLHDIGKLGVPDRILLKEGSLSDEEWIIMRKHPLLAYEMLNSIEYLRPALDIPYCHHEKWDGSGYPRGLRAEEIPLSARIFALADVFDALTSDRPYRKAWPRAQALKYIREQSGRHFDPQIVAAFLTLFQTGELK